MFKVFDTVDNNQQWNCSSERINRAFKRKGRVI